MKFNLLFLAVLAVFGVLFSATAEAHPEPQGGGSCLPIWTNTCTDNSQCCTGFCDTMNGAWAQGVCKNPQ